MKKSTVFLLVALAGAFVILRARRAPGAALAPGAGAFRWTAADQEDADAGKSWGIGALIGGTPPPGATWNSSEGGWVSRDAAGNVTGVYT